MVLKLLLNTPKIWIIFMEILTNTIQIKSIDFFRKKRKIQTSFDNMIADILSNKNLIQQQQNYLLEVENQIFLLFLLQNLALWYQKSVRLNSTHYFIMKVLTKREFQQITINHSSVIDFKDFMNLYKEIRYNIKFILGK